MKKQPADYFLIRKKVLSNILRRSSVISLYLGHSSCSWLQYDVVNGFFKFSSTRIRRFTSPVCSKDDAFEEFYQGKGGDSEKSFRFELLWPLSPSLSHLSSDSGGQRYKNKKHIKIWPPFLTSRYFSTFNSFFFVFFLFLSLHLSLLLFLTDWN